MTLVDANVFMYAAGAPHACKEPSLAFLRRVAAGAVDAAIDAEVLQEILHRYRAVNRWSDGVRVYDLARTVVPRVLPIDAAATDRARALMDRHPALAARDALHAAVAIAETGGFLCSFDTDFDVVSGVTRSAPP